ncbi:unnamed protein product [Malus baccata var. baccata]
MCHYDFVSDDGADEAIINLSTGGQEFSLKLGVVHQYFYLKSIKEVHDDNNLVLEFQIGRTRKQTMKSILTEVVESFAKFQFHNPVWLDFIHASINKRLSEKIDLLKVLNMDAFYSYHDAIVRFQEMANLYIFHARNLFVSLKKKTKHGNPEWLQHFATWIHVLTNKTRGQVFLEEGRMMQDGN